MTIAQRQFFESTVSGVFLKTQEFVPSSSGSNYEFDNGVFNDEIGEADTPVFEFVPDLAFALEVTDLEIDSELAGSWRKYNVSQNGGAKRQYIVSLDSVVAFIQQKFHGFVADSYGELAADIILAKTGTETALFTSSEAIAWNRTCWANEFNLTGAITRNRNAGGAWAKERGNHLYTRRHVGMASHFEIPVGGQVQCIEKGASPAADVVHTRAITHVLRMGGDLTLGVLDSAFPSAITPFALVPSIASQRSPGLFLGKFSDAILKPGSAKNVGGAGSVEPRLQQFQTEVPSGWATGFNFTTVGLQDWVDEWLPFWTEQALLMRPLLIGDSGSPQLVILDAETVGFTSSFSAAQMNAGISALDSIAGISTGLTVTVAPDPTA